MFSLSPKNSRHRLLPMLPREDMGGCGEFFVEPCACNRTPVGFLFTFYALRRLSRKFPCTDVLRRPSPFGEQVKKCMNHLGDSLVGNFSDVSLSACLTKSLFSVCRTPSLFSKSLAASDLYQVSLARIFTKALYRVRDGFWRSNHRHSGFAPANSYTDS